MLLIQIWLFLASTLTWHQNLNDAQAIASKEHKKILLNFSGSDWCGPCIRLHKEVFESGEFEQLAKKNLVLVNADFPRAKKNQLPADQQAMNDALAEKYNAAGSFPLTLLMDEKGNILHSWKGYTSQQGDKFLQELQSLTRE